MNDFGPTHRKAISYIDKSREYYLHEGFANPYRWATHDEAPFAPLTKPLAQCRVGLITTAILKAEDDEEKRPYTAPTQPIPDSLYTNHLRWHKKETHTRDLDSYLPITHLRAAAKSGRIGSLSPHFYGVPRHFSQRLTKQEHAPRILEFCQADQVDVAFLIPL